MFRSLEADLVMSQLVQLFKDLVKAEKEDTDGEVGKQVQTKKNVKKIPSNIGQTYSNTVLEYIYIFCFQVDFMNIRVNR